MENTMRVSQRLGIAPSERPGGCSEGSNCPDGFELESGETAFIGEGTEISELANLPADSFNPPERQPSAAKVTAIIIPREVMLGIIADVQHLPDF